MATNSSDEPTIAQSTDTMLATAISIAGTNTGRVVNHGLTEQQQVTTRVVTPGIWTNTSNGSIRLARNTQFILHHDGLGGT